MAITPRDLLLGYDSGYAGDGGSLGETLTMRTAPDVGIARGMTGDAPADATLFEPAGATVDADGYFDDFTTSLQRYADTASWSSDFVPVEPRPATGGGDDTLSIAMLGGDTLSDSDNHWAYDGGFDGYGDYDVADDDTGVYDGGAPVAGAPVAGAPVADSEQLDEFIVECPAGDGRTERRSLQELITGAGEAPEPLGSLLDFTTGASGGAAESLLDFTTGTSAYADEPAGGSLLDFTTDA